MRSRIMSQWRCSLSLNQPNGFRYLSEKTSWDWDNLVLPLEWSSHLYKLVNLRLKLIRRFHSSKARSASTAFWVSTIFSTIWRPRAFDSVEDHQLFGFCCRSRTNWSRLSYSLLLCFWTSAFSTISRFRSAASDCLVCVIWLHSRQSLRCLFKR